jgi:hypothetical protein
LKGETEISGVFSVQQTMHTLGIAGSSSSTAMTGSCGSVKPFATAEQGALPSAHLCKSSARDLFRNVQLDGLGPAIVWWVISSRQPYDGSQSKTVVTVVRRSVGFAGCGNSQHQPLDDMIRLVVRCRYDHTRK